MAIPLPEWTPDQGPWPGPGPDPRLRMDDVWVRMERARLDREAAARGRSELVDLEHLTSDQSAYTLTPGRCGYV